MAEPVEVDHISEYGLMVPALLGAPAETAARTKSPPPTTTTTTQG